MEQIVEQQAQEVARDGCRRQHNPQRRVIADLFPDGFVPVRHDRMASNPWGSADARRGLSCLLYRSIVRTVRPAIWMKGSG